LAVKHYVKRAAAALCVVLFAVFGSIASAQERAYLQIEAHANLASAMEFAESYASRYDNVVGYRLSQGGWHAIALGPFDDRDAASALRRDLLARGAIPFDAFVATGDRYGEQFWPPQATRSETAALPAEPQAVPETVPEAEPEAREAEPAVLIEPEPPEETLAEARRGEALLDRDERAKIQIALQWKGFYDLGIDAAFGPGTRRAMAAWQEANGHEPTGVLTTRQRAELVEGYHAELATFGFESVRDEAAGIEITLPMGMLEFDRYEAPFAHYRARGDSGVQVLLISQAGSLATLFGLYEIMQTLEIVPLEGFRERRRASFVLTGQSDELRSHSFADYRDGQVKGFTLIWTPEQDARMERVLPTMEESFTTFDGTLPDGIGQPPSAVGRSDLLAGLEVRRPILSRTGFYIDSTGRVLTSSSLADKCSRFTIDERLEAHITLRDDDLGIILLEPAEPLAPLAFANFRTSEPPLRSEVILAGFSFEDLLTRPVLTFGQLAALEGLNGEVTLRRLAMEAMPGDIGGPVFDRSGTVLGMLVPPQQIEGRMLPDEVSFAVSAPAIHEALLESGARPVSMPLDAELPSEELNLLAADMTVLVSCWN
jgi:peptidoglycan hydrolase-like protein with peptidoglycan-binding domain